MSAFRGAPSGVFELQQSSSFRGPQPAKHEYALERDDAGASVDEIPQEESNYEEEEVDESVREDMNKLEDTFPGISDRFRLVNRIGEGIAGLFCCEETLRSEWLTFASTKGRSPPFTRRKIYSMITITMIGTFSDRRNNKKHGQAPPQNEDESTVNRAGASKPDLWH